MKQELGSATERAREQRWDGGGPMMEKAERRSEITELLVGNYA